MEIKREEIEKRRDMAMVAKLNKLKEAQIAEGIIQDCNHWISILDEKEVEKLPKK